MGMFGNDGWLMNLATNRQQAPQFGQAPDAMQMATQPNPSLAGPVAQLPTDPRIDKAMHPGFFGKGGMGGKMLMGALGGALDGVARWGGAQPGYANAMQQQAEEKQWLQRMQAEREQRRKESMVPRVEQVGNTIGILDPATGQFTPTYTGASGDGMPSDAKEFAWWQNLPPEQQRAFLTMKDQTSPIAVAGPTGTFRVPRTYMGGQGGKTVVKTGTDRETGRKIVQYSDGTMDYAD